MWGVMTSVIVHTAPVNPLASPGIFCTVQNANSVKATATGVNLSLVEIKPHNLCRLSDGGHVF